MIHTEKEAAEKWCVNWASVPVDGNPLCGTYRCMAWRWVPDKDGETMKKVGDEYFEVGFCGLAGKPRGVE